MRRSTSRSCVGYELEEAMMMRSLAVAALVVGLASPTLAEQKTGATASPKVRQEIEAFMNKWADAYNRADGNALVSMSANDSFGVGDRGVMTGDQRIERIVRNEQKSGGKVTNLRVEE